MVYDRTAGCLSLRSLTPPFPSLNRRCGITSPLDVKAMSEFWWPTSASGKMIALPRDKAGVYVANVDAWFVTQSETKLAVPTGVVTDLAWADDRTVSMMIDTSPGRIWTCDAVTGQCSEDIPYAPPGLTLAGLVTRVPA